MPKSCDTEPMQRRERQCLRRDYRSNRHRTLGAVHLLLGLEVVEEDAALLGLLTPILDNDARAVDDLAGVALTVNLAYSEH
jgi:hypothetical protein